MSSKGSVLESLSIVPLETIEAARERIAGSVIRTPLIPLNVDDAPASIYLKLENLQPMGSFKLRGASNAMAVASPQELERGVYTASAGNMAQGVAFHAKRLGIPCTVIVPDHAPEAKLAAIERLGAKTVKVPFDRWWQILIDREYPGIEGLFIHPGSDLGVIAGNGTIGLEILEDLPDVDAVVIPFGSGGLSTGIASVMRARRPSAKLYAAEVETGAPLAAAFAAGAPQEIDYQPTFVDGIGSAALLGEMWSMVSQLLDGSLVVSLTQIAAALKLLAERNHVIAEGAGGAPIAAALDGKAGNGKVVCVVSGGNIDPSKVAAILKGEVPG